MVAMLFIGLVLGLTVPSIASRFGKILPADPGLICAMLWHKPRFQKSTNPARVQLFKSKWKRLIIFSVIWGVVLMGLFGCVHVFIPSDMRVWGYIFIYITALLMTVDQQYYLLPDFFTIPLLLLGVTSAYFSPFDGLTMGERLCGAWFGYALSTVSVFVMSFFKKGEFGAGDVKMLTALGAWFGIVGLNAVLVLSFVFFVCTAFLKRVRADAFGPSLGLAGIIVFFLIYTKLWWTIL